MLWSDSNASGYACNGQAQLNSVVGLFEADPFCGADRPQRGRLQKRIAFVFLAGLFPRRQVKIDRLGIVDLKSILARPEENLSARDSSVGSLLRQLGRRSSVSLQDQKILRVGIRQLIGSGEEVLLLKVDSFDVNGA